jgi:hypothetical protein
MFIRTAFFVLREELSPEIGSSNLDRHCKCKFNIVLFGIRVFSEVLFLTVKDTEIIFVMCYFQNRIRFKA